MSQFLFLRAPVNADRGRGALFSSTIETDETYSTTCRPRPTGPILAPEQAGLIIPSECFAHQVAPATRGSQDLSPESPTECKMVIKPNSPRVRVRVTCTTVHTFYPPHAPSPYALCALPHLCSSRASHPQLPALQRSHARHNRIYVLSGAQRTPHISTTRQRSPPGASAPRCC